MAQGEDRSYAVSIIPEDSWQQAQNVILPSGNQTVSEFTRRQAKRMNYYGLKDFVAVRSRIGSFFFKVGKRIYSFI